VTQWAAQGAQYNAAGQLTNLSIAGVSETRTYNGLGQLTGIQAGTTGNTLDLTYGYNAAGQNDGRVAWLTDNSLVNGAAVGETVRYSYDALGRLASAVTDGPAMGTEPEL
jgi:YD repeat-containing protein